MATQHRKEEALAPALADAPGLRLTVPPGIDTDRLGTFTGEIERPAPPSQTALLKARLGIRASGIPRALASEGTFGPHPHAAFIPMGLEILAFVDDDLGIQITQQRVSDHTNFAHTTAARLDDDLDTFLKAARFPDHSLVVRPSTPDGDAPIHKGVRTREDLAATIASCAHRSADGLARLETDMRAGHNPTRMREIAVLARDLGHRLARRCPVCQAPGFGTVATEPGLPCATCRTPTDHTAAEIDGCARCPHRHTRPRSDGRTHADPRYCPCCNP
nr:DUF6671 family protein [Nocardiopsis mwathae]